MMDNANVMKSEAMQAQRDGNYKALLKSSLKQLRLIHVLVFYMELEHKLF